MKGITLLDGSLVPASRILCELGAVRETGRVALEAQTLADRMAAYRSNEQIALSEALCYLDGVTDGDSVVSKGERLRLGALSPEVALQVQDISGALEAMADMGDPDSLRVISIIHRLFADDWSLSGVYEACEEALTKAESEPMTA
jgi:hypothetical protein